MITVQEHRKIDDTLLDGLDLEKLRRRINYDTSRFDASRINLIRYEFDPSANPARIGFYSYFRIGAEWLDPAQTRPLTVVPKIAGIDFIEMFMTCLRSADVADNFSSVFSIDFDAPPIRSKALSAILSPLLVVQYLMTLRRLIARGLPKGYVHRQENLTKVKGHIDIRRNERINILSGHRERVFCHFDEFSVDTPGNRLLKRALRLSADMISLMCHHDAYATLSAMCNHCLSAFDSVADTTGDAVPALKTNKLYHEYSEAIRFAKMIVRRHDIAISRHSPQSYHLVPVFRIDMALLFEHYTLALLRGHFGNESVKYQVKSGKRFIADFLIAKGNTRLIADAKYHDSDTGSVARPDYIKQLSAYARDKVLLSTLGYDCSDEESLPIVPCVLLYPSYGTDIPTSLFHHPVKNIVKFYTCPIPVPTL